MEDNFWNPGVESPQDSVNQYDNSLDSSFKEPEIQSGLSVPAEPVDSPQQPQQEEQSEMWSPQGMNMEGQPEMQLPDIPEAGKPGIDYDMGHVEKISKSLMVGMGDMFDSFGDIADFMGGIPSNEIQKQMFGVETDKPVSDAFHDFADYLHAYGDDVPGLADMQDITFSDMADIEFWETGIARMIPFALSIAVTSGASAAVAGTAATGARVAGLAAKIASGARSVGVTSKIANTLNATRMISGAAGTVAAGATGNFMEGTALAGQTMNEAVAQGVDLKVAQNAGRQVFVDNLASLGADIVQWGLFAGQLKMGSVMFKTAQKGAAKIAKAGGFTAKAAETAKQIKSMTMTAPLKNAAKALGMGAANGITDGVIEQFQEVYQDWSVQRRIAEAKGEEFVPYMEFFMADEQRPTRVLSFATSLLMSGASNTINTAAENRHVLNSAFDSKKESHELLDIFNKKIDEGTYDFVDEDGKLVSMNAEKAMAAGKDSAARTMIQNAVAHGNGESIMEWFAVQAEQKNITQEQFDLYKDTFSEIQESIKSYPTQNLNAKEKTLLVANAWLNNVTAKRLEKQRGDFAQRAEDIQNLVTEKKQTEEWAKQEIAGLEVAAEAALEQELAILDASSKQIAEIYEKNKKTTEENRFAREEGTQLVEIAKKDLAGEELNEQEQFLVAQNKSFYDKSKVILNSAESTNKAANKVGKKEFLKYGKPKLQKDGSIEYTKENKDGSLDAIIVSSTGEVTLETNRDDASIIGAEQTNKDSAKAEFDKFVDTGKVEKATVKRIAYKIKNNRGLTKEETAMRVGAAEEVEALLKTKVETKESTESTSEFTSDELANPQDTVKSEVYESKDKEGNKILITINTTKDGSRKVKVESFDDAGNSDGSFDADKFGKNNTTSDEMAADVFGLVKGGEATLKLVESKEGFENNYSEKQVENRKEKRRAEKEKAEKPSKELDTSGMTKKAAELAIEYELSGEDVAKITPTGKNGRILKADVQKYIKDTPVDGLPEAEGIKLKFLKGLESAKAAVAITKTAAIDYTKKTFTKENVGKIIDVLERAYMKRRIKNAIPLVAGTENAVIDMLSEKAADGLISVNGIINLSKQGPNIAGYASGMSVFVSTDNDPEKEAFFHENFHIFRVLYANSEEVREMMKHVVNQPIYNKTKLDYQENILYAAPSRKGEKSSIRQETALRLIKNRTGDIMATTIEDYIELNSIEKVTADTYKAFYEESLDILTKNNFIELAATEQTNIQDEALTKLAGVYGSYNQDMFISDEGKRKAYNESMKSWKEKISKAFTKEESEWSLEEASNNQYKKGDDFDFEAKFSQIKDLIAKEEAEYGNLAKESPSTVAIKALKTEKLSSVIETEMSKAESSINKDAKAFYKTISNELLKEGEFENATDEQIVANRKALLKSSKEFRQAKQKFVSELLMNYTEGTQEYRDLRNTLRDNNKQVDAYIRQAFVGAMSKNKMTGTQLDMFAANEDLDENALVALINGEHDDIASKFYMHVRQFIENEKYIGGRSDAVKSQVNKANIMFLLKTFQEVYPSPMEFSEKAQAMIKSTRPNPTKPTPSSLTSRQIGQIILGDFFNYLQTEVDGSGSNIFKNVMLQFRSMTTDRGRMWDGKRLTPSLSMQLKRKIASAKVDSNEAYQEEQSLNKENKKEGIKFLNNTQQSIYENGPTSVPKEEYEIWSNLKQRLNYSRKLVELLYSTEFLQEVEQLKFINKFLLSEGNKLTESQFKNLSIKSEDGNYLPISKYLDRSKLEEMLWESVSVGIIDSQKENISLEEFQKRARIDVFTPLFNNYIVNKNRQDSINLGVETNTLTKEKVKELEQVFLNKLADTYKQEKFDAAEFKENTSKKEHVVFGDNNIINSDEAVYRGYFEKGFVDEENPNSRTKKYFLRNSKNDVQELEVKQVKNGFEIKEVKVYKFGQKNSMSMFASNGYNQITIDDMQGVQYPIQALLSAKLPTEDKSYLYTIRTPQGEMLNKNTRKYNLKYGADSLLDYIKTNPLSFLSLYTTDTYQEAGVTIYESINPYAEKIISKEYELEYESLDGDLSKKLDRQEITNREMSVMDVEEIQNAIEVGSNTYMQVVRDFSDKTRRYYATAFTIKTEEEARIKLKGLVDYHMSKTQTILDRHNDESDEFDIHLVASVDVIEELRAEGKEIRKTKNEGHTKKGQLNLLGKRAFELEIDGYKYDLSKYEDIENSTMKLQEQLDLLYGDAGLIGANYLINKFYLQDLSSSMMEEQNYTMKNKRSTGFIANHDSSYAGERVEMFVFEDAELNQLDLNQKVTILAYETDEKTGKTKAVSKEIDLIDNPAIMDSASVITQEAADKLIALHGEIVDVKGSFKLVGYGNNIDNKKISGLFGQQNNTFYAKGHTIIANETTTGPFASVYKSLKMREQYYKDNNIIANVIGYADSAIKKGSIKGVEKTPQNKLSLKEWGDLVAQGDDAVNAFMNKYSYDEQNDLYGYDGRFFGVQGELDKESETSTSSKQMLSGINVFKDHYDVGVQAKAKNVLRLASKALNLQYDKEVKNLSREEILKKNADSDSVPTPIQTMLEDGKTNMPFMRDQMIKLLGRKVINGTHKLRTGGTLSLQESDVLYGYKQNAKEIVQTEEALLPMQVVQTKKGLKVTPAEAVISRHLADELGLTQEDLDGGKEVMILATRIPSSSAGSTVVLKIKRIATKPGNTIAVNPLVSAIIGSDLDGDMLHVNTINTSDDLSDIDKNKNALVESIIDLYMTPEAQSSLTKEIEFKSLMKAHNKELFGSEQGSKDVANDLSLLGTHTMYGQTKGNAPMIGIIASQNLLYNYISEGNPNLFYNNTPLRVSLDGNKYANLDNKITKENSGGTWYVVTKWLNLILDDGKNNVRAKYLFTKNTGNTFIMLLKMGVPSPKISSYIKRAGWDKDEFVYWKQPENEGVLENELKKLLIKEGGKESSSLSTLISNKYMNDSGFMDFNLNSKERVDHLAMYISFDSINEDTKNIGHFLSLDKGFEADPILALEKHQAAVQAIENQTQPVDGVFSGIGNNLADKNTFYRRNRKVNYEIITKFFQDDSFYTNGYKEGLIDIHDESVLAGTDGILNSETSTNKKKEKEFVSIFGDQEKGKLSTNVDANLRMAKAMNLVRMTVNSDIDIISGLDSIYKNDVYGLSSEFNNEQWTNLSTEEKFAYTTQAVGTYLSQNLENDGKINQFLDKIDAVKTSEYILKNGSPKRIKIVRFKPNMNKIINEVDFTDQVRIIQKHFNKLPVDLQNFFVAYDFVTTGWGTNGNSLTPFFSKAKSQKINDIAVKAQSNDKSNFEQDLRSYMKQNKLYRPSKQSSKDVAVTVNARRIASLAYLALYGNDGSFASFNSGGLFGVKKENIGLTDSNTSTTIQDYQSRIDRVKESEKDINKEFQSDNDLLNVPMSFYSGVPEAGMINVLGLATHKEEAATSNSETYVQEATQTQQSGEVNSTAVVTPVNGGSVTTINNAFTNKQSKDYVNKVESLLSTEQNRMSNRSNESKQVAISYGPLEYKYSMGKGRTAIHTKKDQPQWMQELSRKVEKDLGKPSGYYNHVLINRYGDDVGIGTHTDAESIYDNKNGEVGSVGIYSIGETKNKHKIGGVEFQATHNSLAEMSTGKLSHSVGKAKGTRYSINFRHIPSSKLSPSTKFLKVPLYEFDGTSYEGIGQKMDFDKFVLRKLPTKVKYDILSQEDKDSLERDYKIYEASVLKVKALYNEVKSQNIEDAVYDKDMSKEESLEKFNRNRELFKAYNDILSFEKIDIPSLSQGNLFAEETAQVDNLIDELASNPLRRYMEYHFGNHIANNQISTWQKIHGKDLGDISDEMRAKDISSLNMWLSPGDFGKSKPAIAYINKNMKMTHIKYTRNINLVTKEMNEKLENLYEANYDSSLEAKASRLWLKYMPMGTTSINQKLFGNILEITTGLKKVVDADNNVTYRDISDTKIKPSLVYEDGDIKKGKGAPWHKLNKAEQEYLEMYVKFTNFYRDLVENKELYAYNRGGTYVPSITSTRWETLHKRGLFGVYYQMFKGDQDLADVVVEAINPLTGDTEVLDYFSWKSIYMYGSGQKIQLKTANNKKGARITPKKTKSGVVRIEELEKIKRKAQSYVDKGINYKGDKITRNSSVNQIMALESEEAMNRFNHKRSMTSSYLATGNMHAALRSYLSLFMFQHGNAFKDGNNYKHLRYNDKTRAFQVEDDFAEDMASERLAFTGFEDKKQEVDAAIASLGGGKIFDPYAKYGDVKNKNAINYLQKVVKRGLINKERGFTFSDFESEADITNFFVNWTMYVALGLNVPAAFGNVLIGKFNAYRQMGGTNTALGEARYWGMDMKKGYDNPKRIKSRKMIEEFGILTYRAEEIAEGTGGSSLSSLIFSPMVMAENWIQQAAFLGALTDEQFDSYYVDDKGDLKLKDGAKGITSEELAVLERDVVNVQGRGYSETDVRMIQMYALSNMTMQFKRWFPTFLRDRFGKEDIDDLGTMRMGAYTGAADFMSKLRDEGKMWNITEWNAELKKLPKHKQDAVMRYWRGTHGVMIVAMLLAISSMGDSEDEKDSEAFKLLEKLLGDMLLVVNAPKLTYMANIPALNTFKNLNLTIFNAVKGTEYKRKSKYGNKGDKQFVSTLAQLLPAPARAALKEKKSSKTSLR